MKWRIGLFVCWAMFVATIATLILAFALPPIAAHAAVAAVNGGTADWHDSLGLQMMQRNVGSIAAMLIGIGGLVCFSYPLVNLLTISLRRIGAIALVCVVCFSGCQKPFETPEFATIENNETGFLISIEGDTDQAKLASEDYFRKSQVAAKRVQIAHRWNQTGRGNGDGEWIPVVKLIKVDRSPVTRLWTRDPNIGTSEKNEAVHVETRDSVNFSVGFSCTALIAESDAAKFLYYYPAGSLAKVMDTETLGRVQRTVQNTANRFTADDIRSHKDDIQAAVEKDLADFYHARGITITNVAMYGGLAFENPQIQKAIDDAAAAQNLRVVAQAQFDAQQKVNDRLVLEAKGVADKDRMTAEGQAKAKLIAAEAEAASIERINQALEKSNPLTLQFKALEIQRAQLERWDGRYPTFMGAGNPNLLMQIPTSK